MVALVSERFVQRYLGTQAGPGATVRIPRVKERPLGLATDAFEIVGVVADTNGGNWREPMPEIYLPHSLAGLSDCLLVRVSAGNPMAVLPAVRAAVRDLDKDQPIMDPAPLDQLVARFVMAGPRFNLLLFGVFAALGLVLALIGIYGVMSNFVAQREQEIGVRMALGASTGGVMRWVLRSSAVLIGIGLLAGMVGAALSSRALTSIVWNAATLDWPGLGVVSALMTGAGLAAAAIPARRAARTDPVNVLRQE
jgi:putative ABC transport system permease protein